MLVSKKFSHEFLLHRQFKVFRTVIAGVSHCQVSHDAGTGVPGPLAPKFLAGQITLFQPGRVHYPHHLLLAPPMFFTFRYHCNTYPLGFATEEIHSIGTR